MNRPDRPERLSVPMTTTSDRPQTGARTWNGISLPAPGTFTVDPAHSRVGFVAFDAAASAALVEETGGAVCHETADLRDIAALRAAFFDGR